MALFNKYFGSGENDNSEGDLLNEEDYVSAVNHIKVDVFDYLDKEYGGSFSTYLDEYSETSGEEYERKLLLRYEPRIISLMILGYFF